MRQPSRRENSGGQLDSRAMSRRVRKYAQQQDCADDTSRRGEAKVWQSLPKGPATAEYRRTEWTAWRAKGQGGGAPSRG